MSILRYEPAESGDQGRLVFQGETVAWASCKEDRARLQALVRYVENLRAAVYAAASAPTDGEWP